MTQTLLPDMRELHEGCLKRSRSRLCSQPSGHAISVSLVGDAPRDEQRAPDMMNPSLSDPEAEENVQETHGQRIHSHLHSLVRRKP